MILALFCLEFLQELQQKKAHSISFVSETSNLQDETNGSSI